MYKIAAIIPAAGYSSRMVLFKPLLPLSSSLVIENPIKSFIGAGITDIHVVLGHKAELVRPVVMRLGANAIFNPHYADGMYSSIEAGAKALTKEIDAFFLLPADTPFVSSTAIRQIKDSFKQEACDVIYPVFKGKKGHPPLISAKLIPYILQGEVEGGLKELLRQTANNERFLAVEDEGILFDLDSEKDYKKAIIPPLADYPTAVECKRIWTNYGVPQPVTLHMQEVARVSGNIAEALNSSGHRLHLGLIKAASLLHDIAKNEKEHAREGAQIIAGLGYPEVASVVATHMDLPAEYACSVNEHSLVYLSDKLVMGNHIVSLEARLESALARFKENEAAGIGIRRRIKHAVDLQKHIERTLGVGLSHWLK